MNNEPSLRSSPFYSAGFLRRLQKMIETPRGRPTEDELRIDRLGRKIDSKKRAERAG